MSGKVRETSRMALWLWYSDCGYVGIRMKVCLSVYPSVPFQSFPDLSLSFFEVCGIGERRQRWRVSKTAAVQAAPTKNPRAVGSRRDEGRTG